MCGFSVRYFESSFKVVWGIHSIIFSTGSSAISELSKSTLHIKFLIFSGGGNSENPYSANYI